MPVIAVDDKDFQDPATLPHDSLGNDVIICAIVCFIIAAVSVGLRVYTRTKLVNAFAASDWFLFASLVRILPRPPMILAQDLILIFCRLDPVFTAHSLSEVGS